MHTVPFGTLMYLPHSYGEMPVVARPLHLPPAAPRRQGNAGRFEICVFLRIARLSALLDRDSVSFPLGEPRVGIEREAHHMTLLPAHEVSLAGHEVAVVSHRVVSQHHRAYAVMRHLHYLLVEIEKTHAHAHDHEQTGVVTKSR